MQDTSHHLTGINQHLKSKLHAPWVLAFIFVLGLMPALTRAEDHQVSLTSLLNEMTNRETLARWPNPAYTAREITSYDRGLYQNFHGNGLNNPDEEQYWPPGQPTANQQHAGDAWYLHRLLTGQIPEPMLREAGNFFVAGFVRTKRFRGVGSHPSFWQHDMLLDKPMPG